MQIMNACSTTERAWHAALVHETAKLPGLDGQALLAQHVQVGNRCAQYTCRHQTWPCDGRRFAESVLAAQGG